MGESNIMSENSKYLEEILSLKNKIKDLKNLESKLEKSQESFKGLYEFNKTIINAIPFGMDIIDNEGNILFISQNLETLLGKKAIGKKCWELYKDNRQQCPSCILKKRIKIGTTNIVISNGCLGGKIFQITHTGLVYKDKKAILKVFEDITSSKNAEMALFESEETFRVAFESAGIGMGIAALDGSWLKVNSSFCKIVGYSQKELLFLGFQDVTHPKDLGSDVDYVERMLKGEIPYYVMQKRYIHKQGNIIWVFLNVSLVKKDNGEPLYFVFQIQNITKQHHTKERQDELNKELRKLNKVFKKLSLVDPNTGLYNYRYFVDVLEIELHRAIRYSQSLAVAMLDIDGFKALNDAYGNQFGDMLLRQLSYQIKKTLRRYDVVFRYGGDEFVIVSPGSTRLDVMHLMKRLFDNLSEYKFGNKDNIVSMKLTAAIVSYPEDKILKGVDFICIADKVIIKAKEDGGNKIYSTKELDNNKGLNNKIKTAENDIQIVKNKVCNLNNRSNQIIAEAILGFTKTVNVKDKDIGQNKDKIVKYSIKIAQFLGLSKKQIESVKLAAVLYDLGKIGIDKNILLKESTLTEKEFNKIKEHPVIAVDIIKLISSFNDIIPIVLHHHERWDGCGYPSGLKGKEIPIGARILGIADSFQALISARPYRKAYTEDDAIKIIKDDVGLKFDSKIAKVFVSVLAKVQ